MKVYHNYKSVQRPFCSCPSLLYPGHYKFSAIYSSIPMTVVINVLLNFLIGVTMSWFIPSKEEISWKGEMIMAFLFTCLLYTSDAADE